MTTFELTETVRGIIGTVCEVESTRVRGDASLFEYGFDSLRAMEFVACLEDTFHLAIPDELAFRLRTLDQVVAYLERALHGEPST